MPTPRATSERCISPKICGQCGTYECIIDETGVQRKCSSLRAIRRHRFFARAISQQLQCHSDTNPCKYPPGYAAEMRRMSNGREKCRSCWLKMCLDAGMSPESPRGRPFQSVHKQIMYMGVSLQGETAARKQAEEESARLKQRIEDLEKQLQLRDAYIAQKVVAAHGPTSSQFAG
ncbi:hypothetical protein AAVH_14556 [Aphelenchoides avenae]|nr:hypothetical protein AAVH_14556 [Aphelenchus avenae]